MNLQNPKDVKEWKIIITFKRIITIQFKVFVGSKIIPKWQYTK